MCLRRARAGRVRLTSSVGLAKWKSGRSFTVRFRPWSRRSRTGKSTKQAFRALVDWQIASGSHGLVPVGTTGESPTLSHEEHRRVVDICIDEARGRVPVIAGAGSNNTSEAIDLARHAEKAGADAVLVVTPYYNKPTQEGLYQHFKAINDADRHSDHHLQHPAAQRDRHVVDTMKRLYELQEHRRRQGRDRRRRPRFAPAHAMGPDFIQLSGEDMTALACMAAGGARLHLGDRQRRPGPLRRTDGGARSRATSPTRCSCRTGSRRCTPRSSSSPACAA